MKESHEALQFVSNHPQAAFCLFIPLHMLLLQANIYKSIMALNENSLVLALTKKVEGQTHMA
jgi:hypothetical protein